MVAFDEKRWNDCDPVLRITPTNGEDMLMFVIGDDLQNQNSFLSRLVAPLDA